MIKLHLGCGQRDFGTDWIHIDRARYPHVVSHDLISLPYDDSSIDLIYASHVFEYFDREEGKAVLANWYSKLKKGGLLRIAVPDFEAMSKLYLAEKYPLKSFLGPIFGKMMVNGETVYHRTTYDFNELSEVLRNTGFLKVERYDWRKTEHAKFDDFSQAYLPHMQKDSGTLISLNIEAVK